MMAEIVQDPLVNLSEALVERTRLARPLVAAICAQGHRTRSGTLWRKGVVVASEQAFPNIADARVSFADGASLAARVAGRDPGTNIIAFRVDGTAEAAPLPVVEPHSGALVLAFGATETDISVRLGAVHSVGPEWHSRAGGRIDRRITLDIALTRREEGGPILDAAKGLLGISTLGPLGRVLVIPSTTIEGVLEPLLSKGRVERGWLGLALQPVLVPESLQSQAGQWRGLMIMSVSRDSPAAQANLQPGDILLTIGGESIDSPTLLARHLGPESVGQQIQLRLIRAGGIVTVAATVGTRPTG
jgi:S1-C subfamily serine protease